ncbi:MAG: hypothetical protein Q9160_001465 [Pyrenula sp. 1 TL-2023]
MAAGNTQLSLDGLEENLQICLEAIQITKGPTASTPFLSPHPPQRTPKPKWDSSDNGAYPDRSWEGVTLHVGEKGPSPYPSWVRAHNRVFESPKEVVSSWDIKRAGWSPAAADGTKSSLEPVPETVSYHRYLSKAFDAVTKQLREFSTLDVDWEELPADAMSCIGSRIRHEQSIWDLLGQGEATTCQGWKCKGCRETNRECLLMAGGQNVMLMDTWIRSGSEPDSGIRVVGKKIVHEKLEDTLLNERKPELRVA